MQRFEINLRYGILRIPGKFKILLEKARHTISRQKTGGREKNSVSQPASQTDRPEEPRRRRTETVPRHEAESDGPIWNLCSDVRNAFFRKIRRRSARRRRRRQCSFFQDGGFQQLWTSLSDGKMMPGRFSARNNDRVLLFPVHESSARIVCQLVLQQARPTARPLSSGYRLQSTSSDGNNRMRRRRRRHTKDWLSSM